MDKLTLCGGMNVTIAELFETFFIYRR